MSRRNRPRSARGVSLLEILVALPIVALLLTATAMLLLTVLRGGRMRLDEQSARLEARRSAVLMTDALLPLRRHEFRSIADTLLDVDAHVAVGLLCSTASATSVLVAWSSPWIGEEMVRLGDAVEFWGIGADPGGTPSALRRTIRDLRIASVADIDERCPAASTRAGAWLTVDSSTSLLVGGPVLVTRPMRWVHYRSDQRWWIGRRGLFGRSWEATQPVSGPTASRMEGGMAVTPWRVSAPYAPRGVAMATAASDALVLLGVSVRMPIPSGGAARGAMVVPIGDAARRNPP